MRLKHFDHDGRARFITFSTYLNLPVLTEDDLCLAVVRATSRARTRYCFSLLAYVIMPEHAHLLMLPALDSEIGRVVGKVKKWSAATIRRILLEQDREALSKLRVRRAGHLRFRL